MASWQYELIRHGPKLLIIAFGLYGHFAKSRAKQKAQARKIAPPQSSPAPQPISMSSPQSPSAPLSSAPLQSVKTQSVKTQSVKTQSAKSQSAKAKKSDSPWASSSNDSFK